MNKDPNSRPTIPLMSLLCNVRLWVGFLVLVGLYWSPLPVGFRVLLVPPALLCWILLSILFVRSLFYANTIDKTFDNAQETREGWLDLRKSERVKIGLYLTGILALVMSILMAALIISQGSFDGAKATVEQLSPATSDE